MKGRIRERAFLSPLRYLTSISAALTLALGACSGSPATTTPSPTAGAAGQPATMGGAGASAAGSSNGAGTTATGGASTAGASGAGGSGGAGGSSGGSAAAGGSASVGGNAGASSGTGCTGKTICWDFEEGSIPPGWTKRFDQPSGELLVDNSKPFGGSKFSLHAKDIVGQQPQKSIVYNLPANFGPVLWGRMRLFTAGTQPAAHAGFFAAYYPPVGSASAAMNTLDWYEVASYTQAYMSIWHPPWPPGFPEAVQVSDTKLVLDKWTCVEWLFDGKNDTGTEAALPRTWLDGSELKWPTYFAFSEQDQMNAAQPKRNKATNFTVVETGITMWQPMPTANNWWIDDLAVGPERIGCN